MKSVRDKWNREVLACLCEKVAKQTKVVVPDSAYETLLLLQIRRDAENNADWFRQDVSS